MHKFKISLSVILALFLLCSNITAFPAYPLWAPASAYAEEGAAPDDQWIVADAGARQSVTIHNPTDTPLSDIPVLVRLNGTDIPNQNGVSFYLNDQLLSSELSGWNASGTSTYWVRIPELKANTDTVIQAYYGAGDISSSSSQVWPEDYRLVQHFSESAVEAAADSTGKNVLKTTGSFTYKTDSLGSAAVFSGSQKITYQNGEIGSNAAVFSASAIVNFASLAGKGGYYGIICRDRNGSQDGDTFMLTLSNNNVNASVYPNGSVSQRVNVQKAVEAGSPCLLTMTYDGNALELYINGESAGTVPAENAGILDNPSSPFTIGAYSDDGVVNGLSGDLYDVFFQNSVISADEEKFRHANYLGDAVTVGALETRSVALRPGIHYLYDAIIEDTYCFSNGDDGRAANFGSDTVVMQKRTNISDAPDFQSSANRRAFIKLNLAELAEIDPNSIDAVSFDFYQNGDGGVTQSTEAKIVDIDPESWDESTVTWLTMPKTYGLPAAAVQTLTKKDKAYQSFDITNYIKNKIASGETTVSFSIDNEPSSEWGLIWYSREAAENKPRLTVKISGPKPPVLETQLNGETAGLTARIDQKQQQTADVDFYSEKTITLTPENTVVYSGQTDAPLPDGLTTADASYKETFSQKAYTTTAEGKTPYQIYEIALTEEEQSLETLRLTWTGNTAGNQRTVNVYYYNETTGEWANAGSAEGEGAFSIPVTLPLKDALNADGKLQLLIWRGMGEDISKRSSYAPSVGDYDFNIMWVSDPQNYPKSDVGMQHARKQLEWISQHFEETNSKLLINTGDMVDDYASRAQWQSMSDLYRDTIEAAKIPYAFVVGNHDVNRYDASANIFQEYFPVSRFAENNPYFGEKFDDMTYYYLMEEAGAKLMFVGMGIPLTQEAVNWINDALARHPDYTAVLLPHIYLLADGTIDNTGKYGAEMTIEPLRSIIKDNENVRLVLCGHWDGASTNLEYFDGRPVWSLMHDYQGYTEGGYGYFRFLKFDIENNLIYTHTYSASNNGTAVYTDKQPQKEGLYQKHRDEYAIHFDFGATQKRVLTTENLLLSIPAAPGEQIGKTQTITGPGVVSVPWEGLQQGCTYSWYAVITDGADNTLTAPAQTFTVPEISINTVTYDNAVVTINYTASGITGGTPVSIMVFAAEETDDADTQWSGQNVAYQDIFPYSGGKNSISFTVPSKTQNGIAGLDTTKALVIKLGTEASHTASSLFTLPEEASPEIIKLEAAGEDTVQVWLSRPIRNGETFVIASYDESGALCSMKFETAKTIAVQEDLSYTINMKIPDAAKTVKAMWWYDADTMQPLCESKTTENTNYQETKN